MNIWDYYKIVDDEQKKAECLICNGIYSYYSTTGNLRCHLKKVHRKAINAEKNEELISNSLSAAISRHFIKIPGEGSVRCKHCPRDSYHTKTFPETKTNKLRSHLKYQHPNAFYDFCLSSDKASTSEDIYVEEVDDTADSSVKFSSEIWRHFEHEDEGAKCSLCKEAVGTSIDDMKNHLEEHHTSVLDEIIAKAQKGLDADSDDDNNVLQDDNDVYTEVVYLEDESRTKNKLSPRKPKKSRLSEPIKRQIKHERTISASSDECLSAKSKKEPAQDDLEMFINYIRSLLKKVPKDASQKLHLDIINLIMNAQTKTHAHQNIVIETVMDNGANTANVAFDKSIFVTQNGSSSPQNTQRVITVPIQNLMSQIENHQKFIAMPQLISVSSSKVGDAHSISSSMKTSSLSVPTGKNATCSPSHS